MFDNLQWLSVLLIVISLLYALKQLGRPEPSLQKEQLLSIEAIYLEQLTNCLIPISRSAIDLSRDIIQSLHLRQIYEERPLSLEMETSIVE